MKKIGFLLILVLLGFQNCFGGLNFQKVNIEKAKVAFLRVLETREVLVTDPLNREKFGKYVDLWGLDSIHALKLDTEILINRDDILSPFRKDFVFENLNVSSPEKGKVDVETDVVFFEKALMFSGKKKIAHMYATFVEVSGELKLTAITELHARNHEVI